MTDVVVNGAPHVVDQGTRDGSIVARVREAEAIPQHCPKIYLFAERGTEEEWLGAGQEREAQYGAITFDERSKYFTHTTQVANIVNAQGNACMHKRLIPADAGPKGNYTLYIDILQTSVDIYARNADGSIKTVNGQPEIISTAPNKFKYFFTKQYETTVAGLEENMGRRTITEGAQFDPANPTVRSRRIPLLERSASSRGAWGNNVGDRIWGIDNRIETTPDRMVAIERVFPYFLQLVEKNPKLNTTKVLPTALADQSMMFTLKPGSVDPSTDSDMYLGTRYTSIYSQTDSRYPLQEAPISGLVIYQQNIDDLLTELHAAESEFIDPEFHDFTDSEDDKYLFNLFGGQTMNGYVYNSFVPVEGGVTMNRYETLFGGGASDGTMSLANLEAAVEVEINRYADDLDEIQEKAYHVESQLYDSGFSLALKMKLPQFISIRGDTFVTLGTFQEGERSFDNSEELSIAQALKARLMNLPESVWFGTPVLRAGIYGGDCTLRASRTPTKRVSGVMEVAHKRAKYMGAANGKWKNGAQYDQGMPGSLCEITTNYSKLWVPVKVRYRFWDAGLNWWGRYDRSQVFAPAFRTVYEIESSVLTSDTVAQAICQLNKVNDRSWRAHSGTVGQSDAVFTERVNQFIRDAVRDRFDNRFPIEPNATVTESDKARGSISWHSGIAIYSDPMRTVAINYTEAFRNEA